MELEIIVIIGLVALMMISLFIIFHFRKKMNEFESKLKQKTKKSYGMGVNTTKGNYVQILGEFAFLPQYDQLITLSTTSQQPSLDMIGINDESLDFLEIKKKGAPISKNEIHVRRLVEEKKVSYKVFDIELPENFSMNERKLKELKK